MSNDERTANLTTLFSAYLSSRPTMDQDIQSVFRNIAEAYDSACSSNLAADTTPVPPFGIDPTKTVTDDYIICLEDGKPYKMLKRVLRKFGLTPNQYRTKWSLPSNYPMVAKSHSMSRTKTALRLGLGKRGPSAKPAVADVSSGATTSLPALKVVGKGDRTQTPTPAPKPKSKNPAKKPPARASKKAA